MVGSSTSEMSDRKVALVTGASRGIGRAIAIELARGNYDVMINFATNETAADAASAAVIAASPDPKIRVETCRASVADPAERDHLVNETRSRFGRLDLLVNNAGIAPARRVDLLEATVESFDQLVGTNL